MTPMEVKAEAAVQRSRRLVNAWPKVAADQGVVASAVLRVLQPLRAVADDILARAVGAPKGSIAGPGIVATALRLVFPQYTVVVDAAAAATGGPPATGYLSGTSTITAADRALARHFLQLLDVTLPGLGETIIGSGQFGLIKEATHRLLAVATDLDLNTTAFDEVTLLWSSIKDAVRDLVGAAQRKADEGWSLLKTMLLVGAGAAGVYAVATAPWKRR
jgi:hypothetical protein